MKTDFFKISLLIFAVYCCINVNAQHFDSLLKKFNTEYPQEKLYLQFDKYFYKAGETIWFKAYLFSGNFPSLISKTLYTELTDSKGKVLQRIISPVVMSGVEGSIEIPKNTSGLIFIRSYTKWMLNFDSSFLYKKTFLITAPKKSIENPTSFSQIETSSITNTAVPIVLQFFPEGGDLVQGIESRVAFKATDNNGIPVSIVGEILDSKGKKIISFASVHDGMGTFNLQPENSEHYKAVWSFNKVIHETILPSTKQNGIVLETDNLGSQIEFEIKRSSNYSIYPFVYVLAQMNQQQLYKAKVNITKTVIATGMIPTENIPAGIMQITVFTPDEKPIAERIVFTNSANYSFLTRLNISLKDTGKRKLNSIEIDVPDTLVSNLSVAVTDADINTKEEDNIYSHILLTSDIKGFVYDPAYYFSSDADSIANHLDLVMMTNGWRRFKWEDLIAGHLPVINYLPENYLSFKGHVKGLNKKLLVSKEINGVLELKSKKKEFLNIPVQPDGMFSFSGLVFYDTAKLFYQFNKDKNKTLTNAAEISIESNILKDPLHLQTEYFLSAELRQPETATQIKSFDVYDEYLNDLEQHKIKTLQTVVITSKIKTKKELMDEEYTSGYFSNDPSSKSRIILPEDDPAFLASQNLFSYLQGRIAGLQIRVDGTDAYITWRGFNTSLFVNEISQTAISFETGKLIEDPGYILFSIPISEIAMVKIFDPPFFGGGSASSGGEGGAISVYLKKATKGNQMVKGLDYILIPGYSPIKEFYSPDYSMPEKNDIPDYRSTLYWNPYVITDKNNQHIVLSFYNNDITKNMKVIIEGCNENGKLTRIERLL